MENFQAIFTCLSSQKGRTLVVRGGLSGKHWPNDIAVLHLTPTDDRNPGNY